MDETSLRAENERLRDLLIDNGIDPDPSPPEPERFGPPTEMDWRMGTLFAKAAKDAALDIMRQTEAMKWLTGHQWEEDVGSTLRIRKPNNFTVTP